MANDLIRYDLLVQDALRAWCARSLPTPARTGFRASTISTSPSGRIFPGVRLSNRLREKYPQEMTIVLQHQFWDLG